MTEFNEKTRNITIRFSLGMKQYTRLKSWMANEGTPDMNIDTFIRREFVKLLEKKHPKKVLQK